MNERTRKMEVPGTMEHLKAFLLVLDIEAQRSGRPGARVRGPIWESGLYAWWYLSGPGVDLGAVYAREAPGNKTELVFESCQGQEAAFWQAVDDLTGRLHQGGFKKPSLRLGVHGGTLDRVREAYGLTRKGVSKTKACKRVGIDTRTYDAHVAEVVNWEGSVL